MIDVKRQVAFAAIHAGATIARQQIRHVICAANIGSGPFSIRRRRYRAIRSAAADLCFPSPPCPAAAGDCVKNPRAHPSRVAASAMMSSSDSPRALAS